MSYLESTIRWLLLKRYIFWIHYIVFDAIHKRFNLHEFTKTSILKQFLKLFKNCKLQCNKFFDNTLKNIKKEEEISYLRWLYVKKR